jgi:hypothetical protein
MHRRQVGKLPRGDSDLLDRLIRKEDGRQELATVAAGGEEQGSGGGGLPAVKEGVGGRQRTKGRGTFVGTQRGGGNRPFGARHEAGAGMVGRRGQRTMVCCRGAVETSDEWVRESAR